jgi:hypothetical protein
MSLSVGTFRFLPRPFTQEVKMPAVYNSFSALQFTVPREPPVLRWNCDREYSANVRKATAAKGERTHDRFADRLGARYSQGPV